MLLIGERNPDSRRGCVFKNLNALFPGLSKRNPGLELANAFSVKTPCHAFRRLEHLA
jgi:hypothetical protein